MTSRDLYDSGNGKLTLEQRSALPAEAAKCPVKALMSAVKTEIPTLMV